MPGDIDPVSRFVRASSYLKTLPKPHHDIEVIAGIDSVIRTASVPFGAKDTSGTTTIDGWPTLWFTLSDLTNRIYYFQSTSAPYPYWVEFDKLSLVKGSPPLTIDAHDSSLVGEISEKLKAHPMN